MNLKKHLDRAEQALEKGQPDFAAELCDQVLDFAPGDQRAANLLSQAVLESVGEKSKFLGKISSGPASIAAKFQKLIRNPDGEARSMRRSFMRDAHSIDKGISWADALERAGYAGAALGVYSALASHSGPAARAAGDLAAAQGNIKMLSITTSRRLISIRVTLLRCALARIWRLSRPCKVSNTATSQPQASIQMHFAAPL